MLLKRHGDFYARFQVHHVIREYKLHSTNRRAATVEHDRFKEEIRLIRIGEKIAEQQLAAAEKIVAKKLTAESMAGPFAALRAARMREAMERLKSLYTAPALTASELWARYLESNAAATVTESTLETKRQRFGIFITWAGNRDCAALSALDAQEFLRSLDCSPQTKNLYIAMIASVWKASPDISNPWTAALREKAEVNHKQALTRDQVRRLVEYCRTTGRADWSALVLVGYYTGLRLKDAINLRRDQVQDDYIDLTPAKTARTGRRVRIPVAPQLADALAALPLSIGNYFPELAALYQRSRQQIDRQFQRLLCEAKLAAPGVGFHSLRHTFVTEALSAGIELKAVQAVVGHVSETITTGTYYHGETHADLSHYPEL